MTERQGPTGGVDRTALPYQCGRCGHRYGFLSGHHGDTECNWHYARRLEGKVRELEARLHESNEWWWRWREGSLELAGWAWRRQDALVSILALAERLARTSDSFARAVSAARREVVEALPAMALKVQGLVVHDAAMVVLEASRIRKGWWG